MSSIRMSPNSREVIGAISTITSKQEYLKSTNGALNVSGSFNLSGQAIPASGLTTAVAVQIVDGSGNQITSFGGGTQYTDGGVPPAHPVGNTIEWSDGSNWQTVSTAKPLPVTASFSPSGTQDVNVKQISGTAASVNNGTVDAGTQRVTIASDSTGLIKLATGANAIGSITNTTFGATQATAANLNATVIGAGSAGTANAGVVTIQGIASMTKLLVTPDSVALPANQSVNVSQINAVTPLMGNGVTGTGSQRVTIASDNTAFSVNATLSAETTKVIGVTRTADGSGNLLTSTANALDVNIKSGFGTSIAVTNAGTFAVQDTVLDAALIAQEATTSGVKGLTAFGAVTTNAPSYTTVKSDALSLTPAGGLRIDLKDTASNTNNLNVNLAASAATVTVSGTVSITANSAVNVAQINGVTPLMGNGTTGTGSQRVTIASDNTAFSVNATLSAETTKVIGVTRSADGSGNLLTSTSNALDVNLKTSSITLNTSDAVISTVTPADKTGSGSISALNGAVTATTNGCSIVSFNVLGTWSATLLVEGTIDAGSTWIAIDADVDATDTIINNTTANGLVTVNCASYNQVRLRANPYTSGTANITWSANQGLSLVEVFNTNGNSLRVQDLASGTTGATAPTSAQMQGNLAKTALPTATTDGQLTSNMGDKFGRSVILNNAVRDIMGTQTTTITASTSETTIITAVASTFLDLVSIFISNTSATAVSVSIRDTTAGSVIFTLYIPAGDMRGISLTTPWPQTSVNTNWTAQSSGSVTSLVVSALYIKNK